LYKDRKFISELLFGYTHRQMPTRRNALLALVAGSASTALAGPAEAQTAEHHSHSEAAPTAARAADRKPVFCNEEEFQTLTRVCDLIIPRTDTPGAADVGVHWRVDKAVSRNKDLQSLYRAGLLHLNDTARSHGAPSFAALPHDAQIAALTKMSEAAGQPEGAFFQSAKALTIEWYYNTEQGLAHELGYKGNTYRSEFPGCTHPEHWPTEKS
jgi:hypothetical protein